MIWDKTGHCHLFSIMTGLEHGLDGWGGFT